MLIRNTENQVIPMFCVQIGGRTGHPNKLPIYVFHPHIKILMFDADAAGIVETRQECQYLSVTRKKLFKASDLDYAVLPYALFSEDGEKIFYLKHPAGSSFFQSNRDYQDHICNADGDLEIVDRKTMHVHTLRAVLPEGFNPDVLDMDCEGSELPILKGLGDLIHNVKMIRLEALLDPILVGASRFGDVHDFLVSNGFFLYGINFGSHGFNRQVHGKHRGIGSLTTIHALYLRDWKRVLLGSPSRGKDCALNLVKLAACCISLLRTDYAYDVLRSTEMVWREHVEDLKRLTYGAFAIKFFELLEKWRALGGGTLRLAEHSIR